MTACLQIHQIPIFNDNYTYLMVCSETGETAVVDPGQAQPVLDFCRQKDFKLSKILCTHHHQDHIAGNLELKQKTDCKIIGAAHDKARIPGIDEILQQGDQVTVGENSAQVFETWGHTRGHISFYFADSKALFCGDTIFSVGCGRLFEGSPQEMYESLQKIAALPDDVSLYCGHEYTTSNIKFAVSVDPDNQDLLAYQQKVEQLRNQGLFTIPTTVEREKKVNPFLRCSASTIRQQLDMSAASNLEVFTMLRRKKDRF